MGLPCSLRIGGRRRLPLLGLRGRWALLRENQVWTETNFAGTTGNGRRGSRSQATGRRLEVRTRTPPRVSACAVASRQSTSLRVQRPNWRNAPAPEHRSGSPLREERFSAGAPAGISRSRLSLPSSLTEESLLVTHPTTRNGGETESTKPGRRLGATPAFPPRQVG